MLLCQVKRGRSQLAEIFLLKVIEKSKKPYVKDGHFFQPYNYWNSHLEKLVFYV